MYDEAGLHRFGTTLPELDEDSVPSKKPIRLEDQIVTDENGKRRFHGAFTGGFSAGYWNTVGSQEGWTPATFKSSRSEKAAQHLQQRPDDFMDDEDRGEFGIAPQRLQTRGEYTSFEPELSRKRKLMATHSGPIPGKPVLEQLLVPHNVKIGERILKRMGWRPGQGIGPRQTRSEKKTARSRNQREMYVMQQYGYQPNASSTKSSEHSDDAGGETGSSDEETEKITFAPDDYEPYVCTAKKDRFGLGYCGSLSRDPVLSNNKGVASSNRHINFFEPALEAIGKNNKKISFKGQAFGVGALEDEDEDIYARDDMSRYDFSLEDRKPQKKKVIIEQDQLIVDGFLATKNPMRLKKSENIAVPANFTPRNWTERRSRFQPIDAKKAEELESYFKKVEQKNRLNPEDRAEILGEVPQIDEKPSSSNYPRDESAHNKSPRKASLSQPAHQDSQPARIEGGYDEVTGKARFMLGSLEQNDRFTRASDLEKEISSVNSSDFAGMVKEAYNKSKVDSLTNMFKPFMHDEQKQRRYEEFLLAEVKTEEEITCFLNKIQPVHLNEWDREMERKEFIQASKIFRPLDGLMSQRFVSEASIEVERKSSEVSENVISSPKKITVERSRSMWKPHSLLCKRYNIAEPFGGHMEEAKRPASSSKMSVFDYLEDCLHKKSDFKTPVIVPMKIPEIKPILKHTKCETEKVPACNSKSATSVSTCTVSTMTSCSPCSSFSDTSIVVVDQLRSEHAGSKRSKDDGPKIGRPAVKTELEKLSAESISKPSYEKLELYKAIFNDSSDEEGVNQYEVTVITKEGDSAEGCATKKAEQLNLLRNTSPPRGIFSVLLSKNVREKTPEKTECNSMNSIDLEEKSSPSVMVSEIGLIPSSAKPLHTNKIEFKRPISISSKTSVNSASTVSKRRFNHLNEDSAMQQSSKEENSCTMISPEIKSQSEPLKASGNTLAPTSVTFNLPSTSSGLVADVYGPQLPQSVRTQATNNAVDQMNKVVEDKMIRFLVQRAKNSRQLDNEGWVEKKVRKILKTSTQSSSSSSSSDEDDSSHKNERNARKKKSKKSKSHKKSKKKSKEKLPKKSKKNKVK